MKYLLVNSVKSLVFIDMTCPLIFTFSAGCNVVGIGSTSTDWGLSTSVPVRVDRSFTVFSDSPDKQMLSDKPPL